MPGCLVLVAPGNGFAAETGSAVIQSIGFPTANSHKGGFLFWLSSSKGERGRTRGGGPLRSHEFRAESIPGNRLCQ